MIMMENFKHFLVENKHDFSTVQINLPEKLSDQIISWGFDRIPENEIFYNSEKLFFGREDNIHITILYGIHTNNFNLISEILNNQHVFTCNLGKTSLFTDNLKFDVLKIDVEAPELYKINSLLKNRLTVTSTHLEYIPHVTIAYLLKKKGNQYANVTDFNGKNFLVDKIVFSSKTGDKYNINLKEKNAKHI